MWQRNFGWELLDGVHDASFGGLPDAAAVTATVVHGRTQVPATCSMGIPGFADGWFFVFHGLTCGCLVVPEASC